MPHANKPDVMPHANKPMGLSQFSREHWLLPLIMYYLVVTGLLYKA